MSQDEQDLVIGRLVREHTDRKKQYIAITAKLKHSGEQLKFVVNYLSSVSTAAPSTPDQINTAIAGLECPL